MSIRLARVVILIVTCIVTLGAALTVQAQPQSASSTTLKVVYQQFGPPPYYEGTWLKRAQQRLSASHITLKLPFA